MVGRDADSAGEVVAVGAEALGAGEAAWDCSLSPGPAFLRRLRRAPSLDVDETRGPAASLAREFVFKRALLIADVAAMGAAFVLTVRLDDSLQLTWASAAGLLAMLLVAKLMGLYNRDEALIRKTTLDEVPRLFQLATFCALVAWIADGVVVNGALHRSGALVLWIALTVFITTARALARAGALRLTAPERCLFVGDVESAKRMRSRLSDRGGMRAELVAHVDFDEAGHWSSHQLTHSRLREIRRLARTLDIHRVIIAPRGADGAEILDLVRTLKAVGVRVSLLPRLLEAVGSSVEFDDLHGATVMGVRRFELGRSSAAVKRAFDLLGATAGLMAVAPLMLIFSLAIKFDSPGPVFFRQIRVGRHGKCFSMLKFRTMVTGADAMRDSLHELNDAQEGLFKILDDPRVTRIGRFLRRTSLDELPQLINILRGEMSLVGPRPLVVEEDLRVEGWSRRRLELLPGMTGQWQILGPSRVPLSEMALMDYLYVAHWSLWTDVKILLRTVSHVAGRRGL